VKIHCYFNRRPLSQFARNAWEKLMLNAKYNNVNPTKPSPHVATTILALLLMSVSISSTAGVFNKSNTESALNKETTLTFGGRELYVHIPSQLPKEGTRALVVVLHGGFGNAQHIAMQDGAESGLNLDSVADKYGFIVAYLNGTAVTPFLGDDKKGWNAGLCCRKAADNKIDDVKYISDAVNYLAGKYAIDNKRIYGLGHSNGAMMTQRIICETGLYAAGISISGTLAIETDHCQGAQGKNILDIHGKKDIVVPIKGGWSVGIAGANYKKPQDYAKQTFERSGAHYTLQVLAGAGHMLDTIEQAVRQQEGISLQEKIVRFFGLGN
jgi:poly(3-hydroxybutyrate) depolymerase